MIKTNFKNHASLRGTNAVSDEAIQLRERLLAQSTNVALLTCKRYAFTMAEILLSLTIIGVVAAITLPSLMANINERTWNTQRKALYVRMSQAIAMMPSLSGYGMLTEDENGSVAEDTAAETFLTEGLSKVLKINNICDSDHLADCGFTSSITTLSGSVRELPKTMKELNPKMTSVSYDVFDEHSARAYNALNTKAAAFETQNGESVLAFYNPSCQPKSEMGMWDGYTDMFFVQPTICANFVYDLNGNKGPNTVGKDIGFISALYSDDVSVVAPVPHTQVIGPFTSDEVNSACMAQVGEDYRLPNVEELSSLFANFDLIMGEDSVASGHLYSSHRRMHVHFKVPVNLVLTTNYGEYRTPDAAGAFNAMCVNR